MLASSQIDEKLEIASIDTLTIVCARIIELDRYNPFLPVEAGQELADGGIKLLDTIWPAPEDQTDCEIVPISVAISVLIRAKTYKNKSDAV
jgi:hypothetical protein